MSPADRFDWDAWPLIPAVVQNPVTNQVLMVGFMNREALERSVSTGHVTFYSRSRQTLWTKGETSGNSLQIQELRINCEENSLLVLAHPHGPTCHTGHQTCYFRRIEPDGSLTDISDGNVEPDDASSEAEVSRLWYGAYEYLRDNDLSEVSGTSKRLGDPDFPFETRIADELRELAGVLDGTHSHDGLIDDVLLEGSQIIYWITCLLIRDRIEWEDIRPDIALGAGSESVENVAAGLRADAETWLTEEPTADHGVSTLGLVATACRAAHIDPFALIRRDLDDLKTRDYLTPYFEHTQ